jgi:hypothetical protein
MKERKRAREKVGKREGLRNEEGRTYKKISAFM